MLGFSGGRRCGSAVVALLAGVVTLFCGSPAKGSAFVVVGDEAEIRKPIITESISVFNSAVEKERRFTGNDSLLIAVAHRSFHDYRNCHGAIWEQSYFALLLRRKTLRAGIESLHWNRRG